VTRLFIALVIAWFVIASAAGILTATLIVWGFWRFIIRPIVRRS
jgi:hypothetical protein